MERHDLPPIGDEEIERLARLAGSELAARWAERIGERRRAHPGRSALFPQLGDARMRRQIVRWLGRAYERPTPGILEVLHAALDDEDWEVRASAIIVAARLRAGPLRGAVDDAALPYAHSFGLLDEDAQALVAVRLLAVTAIEGQLEPERFDETMARLGDVPPLLARALLGDDPASDPVGGDVPDDELLARVRLLVFALGTPLDLPTRADDAPLPPGLVRDGDAIRLAAIGTEMVWVGAVAHWLGGADGSPTPRRVRRVTPARGFFVARRPIGRDALVACGFRPRHPAVVASALAERLALTPEPPIALTRGDADRTCDALARASGASVELPTADELEMAARGPDARRYPWGNGIERLDGTERSPWGIERFAVPIAQWTSTRDDAGLALAGGGPTAPACAARLALADTAGCALRPVVRE